MSLQAAETKDAAGRKNDKGKIRLDLVEPCIIDGIGAVGTYGAGVYGDDNYKNDLGLNRIYAASLRHMMKYRRGIMHDEDTGIFHPYHAAWGMMALGWYFENKLGDDNNPRHLLNDPFRARKAESK